MPDGTTDLRQRAFRAALQTAAMLWFDEHGLPERRADTDPARPFTLLCEAEFQAVLFRLRS